MKRFIYFLTTLLFLFIAVVPTLFTLFSSVIQLRGWGGIFSMTNLTLLGKSIAMSSVTAFLSTLIGLLLALILERTFGERKNWIKLLLIAPFFFSPYILGVAWSDFFHMLGTGERFIYSPWGVIFVWTMIFAPLSMLVISSQLANIGPNMEESALLCAPYQSVIIKITIPLLRPAILSSFVLVFIMTISEFSVPAFLSVRVFSTEIFTQFSAFHNFSEAVAQGWIIISVAITLLFLERSYLTDAPFISVKTDESTGARPIISRPISTLFHGIAYGSIFWMSVIPVLVLVFQAFKGGLSAMNQAIHVLAPTMINSLFYAAIGALFLVLFGLVFAFMSEEDHLRWVNLVLLVTFSIPSMIFGMSLIYFFNRPYLTPIYSSLVIIIFAYIGRFTFITGRLIANSLKQLPTPLKEAAIMAGAPPWTILFRIIIPLVAPGVFAAFLIAFILNLGELGTTIMVYPPGTSLMPIKVYTIMANAPQSTTSAMTLVVLVVILSSTGALFLMRSILAKYSEERCCG